MHRQLQRGGGELFCVRQPRAADAIGPLGMRSHHATPGWNSHHMQPIHDHIACYSARPSQTRSDNFANWASGQRAGAEGRDKYRTAGKHLLIVLRDSAASEDVVQTVELRGTHSGLDIGDAEIVTDLRVFLEHGRGGVIAGEIGERHALMA